MRTLDYRSNKTGPIWHCRIPREEIAGAAYYAYQIDGPPPAAGFAWHSFDRQKILLDPYALSVFFPDKFNRQDA